MEVVKQQCSQIKNYATYQQFMEHVLEVSPEVIHHYMIMLLKQIYHLFPSGSLMRPGRL